MHRLLVSAFVAVASVSAGVPNVFVPGQPARAEDINKNFTYLDSATGSKAPQAAVGTLQLAVSGLQATKADQSALEEAIKLIAAKVGTADLEKVLKGKVDTSVVRALADLVARKVDPDQLNEVKASVGAKADTLAVKTMGDALAKKADVSWVNSQIAASAPSGMLASGKNLSDLADKVAARANLGLGALAAKNSLTAADVGALTGAIADQTYLNRSGDTLKGSLMLQGPLRDSSGMWVLGASSKSIGIGSAAQGRALVNLWTGTGDTAAVFGQDHISLKRTVYMDDELPLVFTASGVGTYNRTTLYCANPTMNPNYKGVLLEIPRQEDGSKATPSDFELNVRGGGIQILKYDGNNDQLIMGRPTRITNNLEVTGTINGKVVTNGILSANVADYVFEADYKLAPLSEVEAYTKAHKHLPEVPSATEIEKNGLDLAQMNLLLLKKVEELTLHTIALEKRMKAMEEGSRAQ